MGRLSGKVAVITGASSGIGEAIAVLFAKEGAVTVLLGRNRDKLVRTKRNIDGDTAVGDGYGIGEEGKENTQRDSKIYSMDISSELEVRQFSQWLQDKVGSPDILVHSAGTVLRNEVMTNTELVQWENMIDINLKGPFLLAKYLIPLMLEKGRGSIVNISSQLAIISAPGYSTYSTVKGGVLGLTRSIAIDYGGQGIRANCISPGVVETPMAYVGRENFDELKESTAQLHPLKRIGRPDDIAYAALYLASDEASWVTGTNLVVDGGFTAK